MVIPSAASFTKWNTELTVVLFVFKNDTNSANPPLWKNSFFLEFLSSIKIILRPALR